MLQSTFRVIILMFMVFGCIAVILSISGKHWIQTMDDYSGLWEICDRKSQSCKYLENFWLPSVRAFMIVGVSILGLCMFYYICLISSPKSFNSTCMSVFMGVAGIFILIGLSVYTYYDMETFTNSIQYHWSFWIGWFGLLMILIGTVMSIHDARRPMSPFANAHRLK